MNQNERTTEREREIKKREEKKKSCLFCCTVFQESKNAFCPSRIAVFNFDFIISFVE